MATAPLGTLLQHLHRLAAGPGAPPWTDRRLLDDFTAQRDETAFAALLARHGPMVLRVCRRVLHHEQDAEDAFQATFLILARNSGSIRKPEAVADWLYGVAYRTAMAAKRRAARRRKHEAHLRSRVWATVGPTWDDVQAVLDEEIERLPAAFRTAFVLCVLEGKSGPEAAAALGVKEGTVSSRLTRARQMLQRRLTRRGIQLAPLLAALSVAAGATEAAVPAGLARTAVRLGLLGTASGSAAGLIPSSVAALAAGVTRAMFLTKAKIVTAVVLAVGLLAAGAGTLTYQGFAAGKDSPPPAAAAQEEPKPPAPKRTAGIEDKASKAIPIRGRVLDPDGKPITGAKLYQMFRVEFIEHDPLPVPKMHGTSGPDGRFQFTVAKADLAANPKAVLQIVAVAHGFGPGWVSLDKPDAQEITVRLAKDDVPITGRILDLEGRPIRGATIRPVILMTTPNEDLAPWFQAIKDKKRFHHKDILTKQLLLIPQGVLGFPRTATTGADGRFRLTGIGRERVLVVMIGGPKLAMEPAFLVTRPGPKFQVYDNPITDTKFMAYGATFDHVAAPAKPIAGMVRDKDTGKPLAGVTIDVEGPLLHAVTDKEGKYQLGSLPNEPNQEQAGFGLPVLAIPPKDQPYLVGFREVKRGPGLDTTAVNFELKRGVWVQGTVTDKATGKPVRAHIQYQPSSDNPHRKDLADFTRFPSLPTELYVTRPDGSFRVPALLGPGTITARGPYGEYLQDGSVTINLTKDGEPVRCRIVLDPGRKLSGTILDPEGKPLAGVRVLNLNPRHFWTAKPLATASFTLTAMDAQGRRSLVFLHEGKHLAKAVDFKESGPGPLTVRLEPAGTITGRLVDAEGQPRPGVSFRIYLELKYDGGLAGHFPERVTTDRDGRFRVEGLAAGLRYQIIELGKPPKGEVAVVATRLSVKGGESKDLGDVKAKPFRE